MNKRITFLVITLCVLTSCQKINQNQQPQNHSINIPIETEPSKEVMSVENGRVEESESVKDEIPEEIITQLESETNEISSQPENKSPLPVESTSEILLSEIRSSESSETLNWYSNRNKENKPPTSSQADIVNKYSSYYLGDINKKDIYLTFDIDYEIGYTSKILDVLKEKNAPSAFFVTKKYIMDNEELIKRMLAEGHIVANHSNTSIYLPDLSDEQLVTEVLENANYFKQVTGEDMPKFFRVHSVEYSEKILDIVGQLGYETVFWSFAYKDWEVDNQPSKESAYNTLIENLHNGSIMLLHSVSKTNAEVLPDFIDSARSLGYKFGNLDDIKNI